MQQRSRRRLLAFLLTLVLIVGNMSGSVTALAADGDGTVTTQKDVGTLLTSLDDLDEAIAAGQKIIIYYPSDAKVLTATASGTKLAAADASVFADEIIVPDEAVQLTAAKEGEDNGYYTFACTAEEETLYLTSGATGSSLSFASRVEEDETDYALWIIEEAAGDASAGTWNIRNVNAMYGSSQQYLEYYSGFTTYGSSSPGTAYQFQLYAVEEKEVKDPVVENGTYVIYNPAYGKALSSVYTSNYNTGVSMTLNDDGGFDEVYDTEVWTIESKTDGSVVISTYNDGSRLSMGSSGSYTPLNESNDTWRLMEQDDGTYYIQNVGRNTYLEWYETYSDFSTYSEISSGSEGLFAMKLIPVSEDIILSTAVVEPAVEDGYYFIYSAVAGGVMKYETTGGAAGSIGVTVMETEDGSKYADFGDNDNTGAGVFYFEWVSDKQAYLIRLGEKYLTVSSESLAVSESESYWEVVYNESMGGYTLTYTGTANKSALEYYSSTGFCVYYPGTDSYYVFDLLSVLDSGITEEDAADGYVGEIPEAGELPEDGKSYVIYNASGKSVIGSQVAGVDGSASTMGAVDAVSDEDGTLDVSNGGLIFDVTVDEDGYYLFENNGAYLASNDDEELFLMTEEELAEDQEDGGSADDRWELVSITGGYLIKNATAAWSGYSVYIEYYSGGFAGYSFKANSPEIFTYQFVEQEDTYNTGYVVNPKVVFNTKKDANYGSDYSMSFSLDDLGEISKLSVQVEYEDGTAKEYDPTMDGYDGTVTIPSADLAGHTSMTMTIAAESAASGISYSYSGETTVSINDEPLIVSVSPSANASTGSNKQPKIIITYANIGEGATATLTLNDEEVTLEQDEEGSCFCYTPSSDMEDGKWVAVATITRADGESVTKTWSFTVGSSSVSAYFGQIHSHTAEYSDGSGTLEQAYEYSMQQAEDTDYMIVTDHSNYFDTTATATYESIHDDAASSITMASTDDWGENLNLWQEAKTTASYYDSLSSDFVAAYGYEMTWSGGPGHINVYNTLGLVSRNDTTLNNKTNNAGMFAFYDLLVEAQEANETYTGNGIISGQFNHPGTTYGYFDSFAGWTADRDEIMDTIEVGNGDGAIGGTAYFPSYEYYDMCLSVGWHVAPTNNQDNHKGSWGDSNTARTVVLTDDFTEDGIYEAMDARHVYSTEDQNLTMIYELDGTLQGGIIEDYDKDTVTINVSLSDEDDEDLGTVYVIGENGAILNEDDAPVLTGNTADLEITLDNTSAYYYVKVIEADGDIAVSAPVWVDEVNAGQANATVSITNASEEKETNPVVGEEEALTVTLTNEEDSELTIAGYSMTIDGESVVSIDSADVAVASGSEYSFNYAWTPESNGTHQIAVSFVVNVDGETSTISASKSIYVQGTDYDTVKTVAEARNGSEGEEFTLEGTVTSNASGYDTSTAFFDCIYIQDETGGINIFPVAGNYQVGQKVRVHGAITYYNGEIELNLSEDYGGKIELIDETISEVTPLTVTASEAMSDDNVGLLMQVSGTVTRIHEASDIIDRIYVADDSGEEAVVYINGYIYNSATGVSQDTSFGTDGTTIAVGDTVTAIGIGSIDVDELNETEDGYLHRLRVRDRAEVNVISSSGETDDPTGGTTEDEGQTGGTTEDENPTAGTTEDKNATGGTSGSGSAASSLQTGKTFTVDKNTYEVTATGSTPCVSFIKTAKKTKQLSIPDTVTYNGVSYKVTSIGAKAFSGNKKLQSVTIGRYVTKIGKKAFYECAKLTRVTLGANLRIIGRSAFAKCTSLKTITIPSKVTRINSSAFRGDTKLTTVVLGKNVTIIGSKAFYNCKRLSKITIKSTRLEKVGSKALKGIRSTARIKVPAGKLKAYKKLLKGKGQSSKVTIK